MQSNGWGHPQPAYSRQQNHFDPTDSPEYEIPEESETGNQARYIPSYPVPTQASRSHATTEFLGLPPKPKSGLSALNLSRVSEDS